MTADTILNEFRDTCFLLREPAVNQGQSWSLGAGSTVKCSTALSRSRDETLSVGFCEVQLAGALMLKTSERIWSKACRSHLRATLFSTSNCTSASKA